MSVTMDYFTKCKNEQRRVVVIVSNGFQMRGVITDFDENSILVNVEGVENLVSRFGLLTVKPDNQSGFYQRPRYGNAPWGRSENPDFVR